MLFRSVSQSRYTTLEVDDLLDRKSKASNLVDISSIESNSSLYDRIRINRIQSGERKLSIESDYVQTSSAAENLVMWIMEKASRPRKNIGAEIFSMPVLQLGDLVTFDYEAKGNDLIADKNKQFVVYQITYAKEAEGTSMTIYATEV